MISAALVFLALSASTAFGQQVGTGTAEVHPRLPWQECNASGCVTKSSGAVALDANWRWIHNVGGYTNCYSGNLWNTQYCPTGAQCVANCALEGADYSGTYGITTSGNALTLRFVTGSNVGSRVYLMESDTKYQIFHFLGKEFSFDVDVSKLPCGLNGALYTVQMDADGGMSKYPGNKAGAKYGTGYCDAQCPRDIKYIAGEVRLYPSLQSRLILTHTF